MQVAMPRITIPHFRQPAHELTIRLTVDFRRRHLGGGALGHGGGVGVGQVLGLALLAVLH